MDEYLIPDLVNIVNEYEKDYLIGTLKNKTDTGVTITIVNIHGKTKLADINLNRREYLTISPYGIAVKMNRENASFISSNLFTGKEIRGFYSPTYDTYTFKHLYSNTKKTDLLTGEEKNFIFPELHPEPYIYHVSNDDRYMVVGYGHTHFTKYGTFSIYEDCRLIKSLEIPQVESILSINSRYLIALLNLDFYEIIEWRTGKVAYTNAKEHKEFYSLLDDYALGFYRNAIIKRHIPSGNETVITECSDYLGNILTPIPSGCLINASMEDKIFVVTKDTTKEIRVDREYDYVSIIS